MPIVVHGSVGIHCSFDRAGGERPSAVVDGFSLDPRRELINVEMRMI
ncbi:hypothetical protein ACFVUS_25305 [Nocardia sp. NPDC058058]